jgi:hypothetical protein
MMSSFDGVKQRLVAIVRAITPHDWSGRAGKRFRQMTRSISDFTAENDLELEDVLEETVSLGRRKLQGLANKEFATAVKDFADAEHKTIETQLQRRAFTSKLRQEEAQASKLEAEARLANFKVVDAELDLLRKLQQIGVTLRTDL